VPSQVEVSEQAIIRLVLTLDPIGTFVFALSGAAAGIKARLDVFGVLVLSFVVASAGGIVRDLLLGSVPPAAVKEWWYMCVSFVAGLVMFDWHPRVYRLHSTILVFDAAGLAVFTAAGRLKALAFEISPCRLHFWGCSPVSAARSCAIFS
jgi:uncharacterized membrane protein YeiH